MNSQTPSAPTPPKASLEWYGILDTLPEDAYDDIARLAASLCGMPIALISFVDRDRQWFKACVGSPVREVPHSQTFCASTLQQDHVFLVPNALEDARFRDNPMVAHEPNLRSYAGVPLVTAEGSRLGTLCVMDFVPRALSPDQAAGLQALARQVMHLLELRKVHHDLEVAFKERGRLLQILDSTTDFVASFDRHGKPIYVNNAAKVIWTSEQSSEGSMSVFSGIEEMHPPWVAKLIREEAFPEAVTHGHWRGEMAIYVRGPQGRVEMPIDEMLLAHRDGHGNLEGFSVILRDLTSARERQAAEIKQIRLLADQRARAVEASRLATLGEMAAGIGHEINNPLAIIHGTAALLRDRLEQGHMPDAAQLETMVRRVLETAERIARIVRGLRTFSHDGSEDEPSQTRILAVLNDAMAICRERFNHNGVEFRVKTLAEAALADLVIEARGSQIAQVMLNLLSNAFDAVKGTDEAWVSIDLRDEGEQIVIEVTDSGTGIPVEVASKMFNPFFTTKQVGKGTGLGLSLSHAIVQSHGGRLHYDSAHTRTRFVMRLPKRFNGTPLRRAA